MPTKTTKSNGNKKQAASLALASKVIYGPPFAGSGPFGGVWSRSPQTPTTCPGFWTAVRHFPTTGGIVAQLGAQPGTGAVSCTQYVYYQYDFQAQVAGEQTFILTLNLGPVTRLPRGGQVYFWGVLQISGPGGQWADVNEDLSSNTGVTLSIRPWLQAGGQYRLRFGVAPIIQNAGFQSYGEVILNSANLVEYLAYGVQAAQSLSSGAGVNRDTLMALLNPGKKEVAKETSMEEAIKMGSSGMM
jgi:hypothetical protein